MIRLVFHLLKRFGAVRRAQVGRVALLTVALLAFSTTGFLYFELEHKPDLLWGDAFWWSVVTMTTVGYGDLFPSTPAGRYLIGFPTMLFGIGVLGYLFSTVASFLLEARSRELRGMAELFVQQHILVIHYPSEARLLGLLDELRADPSTKSLPVVLIDEQLEELPPSLSDRGLRFVRGAATKESVLAKAMVADAKHAILLARHPTDPSSDDSTLAAVLTLEHVNPAVRTVAECVDPERVPLMRRAGCDAVVCLAEMSSSVLVSEVSDPGVHEVLLDLASNDDGQQIYMVPVEPGIAQTFADVQRVLAQRECLAIGLRRAGKLQLNPGASAAVVDGDIAVCVGATRPAALTTREG